MLAYGRWENSWDEYLRTSKTTCLEAMIRFAIAVVNVFGPEYLRELTVEDTTRLMALSGARGWPSML